MEEKNDDKQKVIVAVEGESSTLYARILKDMMLNIINGNVKIDAAIMTEDDPDSDEYTLLFKMTGSMYNLIDNLDACEICKEILKIDNVKLQEKIDSENEIMESLIRQNDLREKLTSNTNKKQNIDDLFNKLNPKNNISN